MSQAWRLSTSQGLGFPRVSGDEPEDKTIPSHIMVFSPRERG